MITSKSVKSENIQGISQLYAKMGKLKNRTPLLSESSVFVLRSRADSNRCKRFCRPLPSHSATRPGNSINYFRIFRLKGFDIPLLKRKYDKFVINKKQMEKTGKSHSLTRFYILRRTIRLSRRQPFRLFSSSS